MDPVADSDIVGCGWCSVMWVGPRGGSCSARWSASTWESSSYPGHRSHAWLSFGRLRPVHTNTVFWGWSSLAMIGMALYVVPKTSRRSCFSFPLAYVSLALINVSVGVGDLLLVNGINNGGQEYREYIWPVQAVFSLGVILVAYNLIRTITARDLEEIYISNWYIVGGLLWTIALIVIAYRAVVPAERHQRDGDPGLLHAHGSRHVVHADRARAHLLHAAASPQQAHLLILARRPRLLDADGLLLDDRCAPLHLRAHPLVVADGRDHLQRRNGGHACRRHRQFPVDDARVANTRSAAATACPSFWPACSPTSCFPSRARLRLSGRLQALWHFTNYTVAHSHLTMYGFVAFLIWGTVYGLVPRMTGHEPSAVSSASTSGSPSSATSCTAAR